MLKNDFQNEIFTLKKEHQRQISNILEEKILLEHELEKKEKEINRLKFCELITNLGPENKENNSLAGNRSQEKQYPPKSLRKKYFI